MNARRASKAAGIITVLASLLFVHTASAAATVECGRIDPPVDGRVVLSGGRVVLSGGRVPGAVATYSCLGGYVLEGTSTRICLHTGRWSDREPTCSKCKKVDILTCIVESVLYEW